MNTIFRAELYYSGADPKVDKPLDVRVETNNCPDGLYLDGVSRCLIVETMPHWRAMKRKNLTYYEATDKTYETYVKFNKPIQLIKEYLIVLAIEKEGEQKHNAVSAKKSPPEKEEYEVFDKVDRHYYFGDNPIAWESHSSSRKDPHKGKK